MMSNYMNTHQLDKAKQYAKRIMTEYPKSLETEQASIVLGMKE